MLNKQNKATQAQRFVWQKCFSLVVNPFPFLCLVVYLRVQIVSTSMVSTDAKKTTATLLRAVVCAPGRYQKVQ